MSKPTSSTPTQKLSAALADLVASAAPSVVAIHSGRSRSSGCVGLVGAFFVSCVENATKLLEEALIVYWAILMGVESCAF
jgi:hypothetical protein